MSDLHHMTVLEILPAFESGELRPSALIHHLLERITQGDATLNCIVDTLGESALEAAEAADDLYAAGGSPRAGRPLLGVPFLVKEQHDVRGLSATRGSAVREGMIAQENHPIVERLIDAGAIPIGRTTTPEFSCATFSQTAQWGESRNPFNPAKTPGGSSGGSGGAVAAGFAPFATASDIAGSTRIPAAFNGLPGFKTPYGYTPGIHPLNADWYRGDHILARTVADTALLTSIISGIHPQDHCTVPPEDLSAISQDTSADVSGMRIAVSADLGMYELDPSVEAGVDRVTQTLKNAGAIVEVVDLRLRKEVVDAASMAHFGHLIAANIERACDGDTSRLEPYTARFVALAKAQAQSTSLLESMALEQEVQDAIAAAMAGYDALVTATSAVEDLDAGNMYLDGIDRPSGHQDFYWESHMTVPFNIANRLPVMAVPSGMGSAGIPTSVQIVGHPYASGPVFTIARALEALLPFPRPAFMS